MTLPLVTFLVFFAGIVGAYWGFVVRPEDMALGRVRRRLKHSEGAKASVLAGLRKHQQAMSAVGPLNKLLGLGFGRVARLQKLIDQSGVRTTVGTVVAAAALIGLIAGYAAFRASGWLILGVGVAVVAIPTPFAVLRRLRTLRLRRFEEQLPESLDLMARALRAGHAFTTGLEMVATEMPSPSKEEFRLLFDQQNYGMPMEDALKAFADRVDLLDARFFVTAVLIQRESGGNLSEVLDNLSRVIRERFRVKRQMRVASAHGRITGWVLVCLPPVLGLVLMSVNPQHRELMFGERLGIQMMVGAAVLQGVGTLIIRKIINVEY